MSSSITILALAAAAGLVLGWLLCHFAHTTARADAKHYRDEAELLRVKAIRIDERRLSAQAEADALFEQLEELRLTMIVDVDIDSGLDGGLEEPAPIELDSVSASDDQDVSHSRRRSDVLRPPVRPGSTEAAEHDDVVDTRTAPGRLAEAFGTD